MTDPDSQGMRQSDCIPCRVTAVATKRSLADSLTVEAGTHSHGPSMPDSGPPQYAGADFPETVGQAVD